MEVVVIVAALVCAGLLITRGLTTGAPGPRPAGEPSIIRGEFEATTRFGQVAMPVPLLPGRIPIRVFTPAAGEFGSPRAGETDYVLSLRRGTAGDWTSVLRAPAAIEEGGTLTLTLLMPWSELSRRYSAVNLVVR